MFFLQGISFFLQGIRPLRQARTRALVALVATARLGASCLTSRLVSVLISVVLDRGAAEGPIPTSWEIR
jgi:hypothetical protein